MCMVTYLRVKSITEGKVLMEDGREVRLGDIDNVGPGDYLEVYANLAIAKVEKSSASMIRSARRKGANYVS